MSETTKRAVCSRRALIAMSAALPVARSVSAAPVPARREQPAPDYLLAVKDAARWIGSAAKETSQGTFWLPDPDQPDKEITVSSRLGLYSGGAGVVLFYLQLAQATGDESFLTQAKCGADFLIANWQQEAPALQTNALRSPVSFYSGLAGVGFTLAEAWKATSEERYRGAAAAVADHIAKIAKPSGEGVTWTETPALGSGDSGVALYLLYAAKALGNDSYRQLAARSGTYIVGLAQQHARGGVRWSGVPGARDAYFPNFELGTAGVAYTLARLYEETKEPRFLAAATKAPRTSRRSPPCRVIRRSSSIASLMKRIYYLGLCHGPTGRRACSTNSTK